MPGTFPERWIHGSPGCAGADPPLQVHAYDRDTLIIREGKCANPGTPAQLGPSFEAPFMYLLFGNMTALLLDSGDTRSPDLVPIASTVRHQINVWLTEHGRSAIRLVVCHSHSHADHAAGDAQFLQEPGIPSGARARIVGSDLDSIKDFFGIADWPNGRGRLDLGGRVLDVIPLPGHQTEHIALYDRNTQLLFTGDSLFPGLLFVEDFGAYRNSINQLAAFIEQGDKPVAHVLGAHIEMKRGPGKFFGYPHPFFQPNEHVLQLERRHLFELRDVVKAMGPVHRVVRRDDFIVFPEGSGPIPLEDL